MSPTSVNRLKITLFCIFALSGFSGLIYESIWTHYIKLILGHAAYAQTLVLSIFMGGLAIGAALTGRNNRPIKSPLKAYAVIEGIIGFMAIVFHMIFIATESLLHDSLIPAIDSVILIETLRWSIAALLILPQSILLGTTFPLIGTAIIRLDRQHSGSTLGMLYFSNSMGAAIGVLVSAFVLISLVGLPGTILTAGLLNIGIAIVVYGLSKNEPGPNDVEKNKQTDTQTNDGGVDIPLPANWLFGIALLTGLASFFYEIGWIRMLSLVLSSSMQAFEIMLSGFITGIAFGGLWIRKRIETTSNPALFLGKVQIAMGICALATLPLYGYMFDFMGFIVGSLEKNDGGYVLFNLSSHVIALIIMLPATFMAGMTLPLITFTLLKWKQGEASIGRVYAFNTVGAIAGILLAVHIGMPLIGTKGLIITGAAIDIGLGLFLLARFIKSGSNRQLRFATAGSIIVLVAISFAVEFDQRKLASGVYRYAKSALKANTDMLYYKDGKTASISVYQDPYGTTVIATNGKPDAGLAPLTKEAREDEPTMIVLAALPLAIHPEAKTLANIGMGSGLTTHTLLTSPQLIRIDTIEIEPAIIEGIAFFGDQTNKALTDPRSNIIIDDAKSFFSRNKTKYDIIISEPSNPWVSGVGGLFSTEFYQHINRYLNNDGLLVQWLQLYESNINLIDSVIKAVSANFTDYAVYSATDVDIIIIASNSRDVTKMNNAVFNHSEFNKQLTRIGINDIEGLSSRLIGTKKLLQPLFDRTGIPMNSDYFPYLSLNAPKARYLRQNATEFKQLHLAPFPPANLINPIVSNKKNFNKYYEGDVLRQKSQHLANILLNPGGTHGKPTDIVDFSYVMMANIVSSALNDCELLANNQAIFDSSIQQLAELTISTTDSTDIGIFWRQLSSTPCLTNLSEEKQLWVKLYSSIAMKNHKLTAEIAQTLLTNFQPNLESRATFALGAAINAYVHQGEYDQAGQLMRFIQTRIQGGLRLPLYLRVLYAQVEAHRSKPTF